MATNIIELAEKFPELSVTIRLGDLIKANQALIDRTSLKLAKMITDVNTERTLSKEEVALMLGVTLSTLWRWDKLDYLKPERIGRTIRYKMSDVKRILDIKQQRQQQQSL